MNEMLQWVRYSNQQGFNFNGRARRSEYWYNLLFYTIASAILNICLAVAKGIVSAVLPRSVIVNLFFGLIAVIIGVIVFLKMLPVTIRRLHDTNKSGWIYLLCWITTGCFGIGRILWLIFMVQDSTPGSNQFGPNPKGNNTGYNGY